MFNICIKTSVGVSFLSSPLSFLSSVLFQPLLQGHEYNTSQNAVLSIRHRAWVFALHSWFCEHSMAAVARAVLSSAQPETQIMASSKTLRTFWYYNQVWHHRIFLLCFCLFRRLDFICCWWCCCTEGEILHYL